jgi:hypothetical protein
MGLAGLPAAQQNYRSKLIPYASQMQKCKRKKKTEQGASEDCL